MSLDLSDQTYSCPETFSAEGRAVVRTIRRRTPEEPTVKTIVAMMTRKVRREDDLNSLADLAYLRGERPKASPERDAREIRVVDLFSGCGAMSLGVREACDALNLRFTPLGACENDPQALQVFSENFLTPSIPPVDLSGISSLIEGPSTPLEVAMQDWFTSVDCVVAGPPCQGHSNLNNHTRRTDPKNALYMKVARFARLFSPRFIMIENVPAVVKDTGNVVGRTTSELTRMGYRVVADVVNLTRLGVPQTRRRHLLVAARDDLKDRVPSLQDFTARYARPTRTVQWAIEDLLSRNAVSAFDTASGMKPITKRRVDYLFEHDLNDLPDRQRPDCHKTKEHTYTSVYGRMSWDAPAPTITRGFGTMGQGRFIHPLEPRTLTPHEAARLQLIPDSFVFGDFLSRKSLNGLIGNAVPPRLSYLVALEILR